MTKKFLRVIMLMLALVFILTACGHTHSYGEWEISEKATCTSEGILIQKCSCGDCVTKTTPKTSEHTFLNGNCTNCNLSVVTAIGDIVKQNPDQYTAGAYFKLIPCSNFSSKEDSDKYILSFAYTESKNSLLIQLRGSNVSTDTIDFIINSGVISNFYDYTYSHTNPYGPFTDKIKGVFNATTLSSTTAFTYTSYTAGSDSAFTYFVEDYEKDAASLAKLLVEYLNDFLSYNELGFTAEAFNLK